MKYYLSNNLEIRKKVSLVLIRKQKKCFQWRSVWFPVRSRFFTFWSFNKPCFPVFFTSYTKIKSMWFKIRVIAIINFNPLLKEIWWDWHRKIHKDYRGTEINWKFGVSDILMKTFCHVLWKTKFLSESFIKSELKFVKFVWSYWLKFLIYEMLNCNF